MGTISLHCFALSFILPLVSNYIWFHLTFHMSYITFDHIWFHIAFRFMLPLSHLVIYIVCLFSWSNMKKTLICLQFSSGDYG